MRLAGAAAVALGVGLAGCGGGVEETDNRPRQPVSGTVTLGGQPLATGSIQFQPRSAREGVVAGAIITDGKYSIPRDQGLVPGAYAVTISSVPPYTPPPGPPGSTAEDVKGPSEMVPEGYNARTTLAAKVEAGKVDPIDFALEK